MTQIYQIIENKSTVIDVNCYEPTEALFLLVSIGLLLAPKSKSQSSHVVSELDQAVELCNVFQRLRLACAP
jgi:hypothetical protein